MTEIKVSIIVPCYNVEKYLSVCLDSLINQTLKEIEIICVDDGSTDSTLDILNEYRQKDSRIEAFSQRNSKQGAARNNGIRHAKGEFIGFVDSDDYVDEDYFEKLYTAAHLNDADISTAGMLKHKSLHNKYNVRYRKSSIAETLQDKIRISEDTSKRFFYVMNKLFRSSLLKSNNILFPENRQYEDVWFSTVSIFYARRIVSVPDTLYHYIQRPGSTVNSTMTEKKRSDYVSAYSEIQSFAKEHRFPLPEKVNYYESHWINFFIKRYRGKFREKYYLFGLFPTLSRDIV